MGALERAFGRVPAYLPEGGGEEFIQRLKAAVRRVNKNKADRFWYLSSIPKGKGKQAFEAEAFWLPHSVVKLDLPSVL